MNLEVFYELRDRLEDSAIAGINLLSEDFRLKRAVEKTEAYAKTAAVFKQIYEMGLKLLDDKTEDKAAVLLDELALLDDTYLIGRISAKEHPFVEYYKFLKQFEDENTVAKYTIPAPAQTFQQMIIPGNLEITRKFYPTNEELIEDIGRAYQNIIKQFYEAGCHNLQFDDCTWGAIVGDAAKMRYKSLGIALDEVKKQLLAVNNLALENKPEDMIITSHICRGNYHSTYFNSGAYDTVADYVFAKENVDALFLEYDDERSGGFAPLAKVSADKKVVLGLITTKSPVLEDKSKVIERIYEAAKYIPIERLCLSPQCGFASCEIGNKLTEEEQWNKLKLVKEIAEEVWGK